MRSLRGRGVEKSYLDLTLMFQEIGFDVHLILREDVFVLDASNVTNIHILQGESEEEKISSLSEILQRLNHEKKIDLLISSNVHFMEKSGFYLDKCYFSVNMSWGYRLLKRLRLKKYFQIKKEYKNKQIIAVSKGVKKDLLDYLKIKPSKLDVIYDPYDVEKIQKLANKPMQKKHEYIVHVGAFDKIKRHDILIKAFALLDRHLHLYLIGEGKEKTKIQDLVKKLGIESKVHFLGWKSNPYPYIKQAKLTVLSSQSEALPRVIIESLIIGTTVVSTDCNFGPSEILQDELKNYLTPVNNPKKLAQKITWALSNPITPAKKYYQRFSKEEVLGKYISLIKE